jgi:hypothetical protein
VEDFDYATCHHIKWTIIINGGDQNFKKKSTKNPHSATCQILMDQWKVMSTWCYHGSCKLITLELHNSCFYIVVNELHNSCFYIIVNELHKLHMYIVSHIVNCIYCNLCDLFDNTHTHKNMLSCNELQMVIATQKPSCKTSYISPHFLKVASHDLIMEIMQKSFIHNSYVSCINIMHWKHMDLIELQLCYYNLQLR